MNLLTVFGYTSSILLQGKGKARKLYYNVLEICNVPNLFYQNVCFSLLYEEMHWAFDF